MLASAGALMLETARRGELHHSLILHGPSPAVLSETAIHVAKALTCLAGTTGDDCTSCQKIARGNHPDVHLVQISEDRKLISAEQIRDVVSEATLRPYEGRWKVFIVERADATSVTAANAMLKTLEEPSRNTSFMLLTRSPELLLPTIRSRSQSIYIGPPSAPRSRALQSVQLSRFSREEELQGMTRGSSARLAGLIVEALDSYATSQDTAALLSIAPLLASQDDPGIALALFAGVLRDLAALAPEDQLEPERARRIQERLTPDALLSGAAIAVRSLSRLVVNTDLRMLAEQSLTELALAQRS